MIKHAVILAIGNTQFHSKLTYNRSHALLPALGKPLFVRVMERLYRIGIRHYTVIVGEAEGAVASYLNSQWMPDVSINLVIRFPSDSLLKVMKTIAHDTDEPFIVCRYNSFSHTNFPERLLKRHADFPEELIFSGAPTSLSQAPTQAYATIDEGRVVGIRTTPPAESRVLVLNDLYVCGTNILEFLRQTRDDLASPDYARQFLDIAALYLRHGGSGIMAESNWILQVEADRDLLTLNKMLLDEGQDTHILSELPYTVKIIPPVRIDPQVSVGQGATIGPHVYLERGSSVGHDVVLRNSMVLSRANVPAEKTVVNTILTTRGPIT